MMKHILGMMIFLSLSSALVTSCMDIDLDLGPGNLSGSEIVPNTTDSLEDTDKGIDRASRGTVTETIEAGSKTAYTTGTVALTSGSWTFTDTLIGTSTNDRKNGVKSARLRYIGKLGMNFNATTGMGVVTVKHAQYGSDGSSTWELWYSANSGSSWTKSGSTITASSTTLQTATFTINLTGTVRLEIRKTNNTTARLNIDDVSWVDYSGGSTPPPVTNTGDTCATAIDLNVQGTRVGSILTYNGSVTASAADFTGCAGTGKDIVFKYVVPTGVASIIAKTCSMTGIDTVAWIGTTCGANNMSKCDDDGCGTSGGPSSLTGVTVTAGSTYYLVVKLYGTGTLASVNLEITETSSAPPAGSGDNCSSVLDLNTLATRNGSTLTFNGSVSAASSDFTGCAGTGKDVVFKYSIPTGSSISTVDLSLCNQTGVDTVMWMGTTCGANNLTQCDDDGCGTSGGSSKLTGVAVTAGTTYYIVVKLYGTGTLSTVNLTVVENSGTTPPPTGKRWTIMVYMDGDNDLEEFAVSDFNEMETVTQPTDVNILVLFDRITGYDTSNSDWKDTRAYLVQKDTSTTTINSSRIAISTLGVTNTGASVECNMGTATTLEKFMTFAKTTYPAQAYALVLWNHGAGWKKWNRTRKADELDSGWKAVCADDTSGSILWNKDIRSKIGTVFGTGANKTLDVLGFDACIMGTVETGFEFNSVAKFASFSMRNEPGDGYYYGGSSYGGGWLTRFFARPTADQTARNLVTDNVNAYRGYYQGTSQSETQVAVDLSYMPTLAAQVNAWTATQTKTSLDAANNTAQVYDEDTAGHWSYNLFEITQKGTNPNSAEATAIRTTLTSMTVANYNLGTKDGTPGLAIHCGKSAYSYTANTDYICTNILWACTDGAPAYATIIKTW